LLAVVLNTQNRCDDEIACTCLVMDGYDVFLT